MAKDLDIEDITINYVKNQYQHNEEKISESLNFYKLCSRIMDSYKIDFNDFNHQDLKGRLINYLTTFFNNYKLNNSSNFIGLYVHNLFTLSPSVESKDYLITLLTDLLSPVFMKRCSNFKDLKITLIDSISSLNIRINVELNK